MPTGRGLLRDYGLAGDRWPEVERREQLPVGNCPTTLVPICRVDPFHSSLRSVKRNNRVLEVRWTDDNGGLIKVIRASGVIDIEMVTMSEAKMMAQRLWGAQTTEVEVFRGLSWAPSWA